MRTERDPIGTMEIEEGALYGIHAARARGNFPDTTPFHIEWYKAIGTVKLACYRTYRKFIAALSERCDPKSLKVPTIDDATVEALIESATEVSRGEHFEHFIVPAISGGAGTSQNMNVNEIIANASLMKIGKRPGDYEAIDPIAHANVFQSTNDVIPTALRVAAMELIGKLERSTDMLRQEAERLEKKHRGDLRIAFTQMQGAVPSSYGKLFGSYADALSRDWWRTSKVCERIKVVNLGGCAVGTGLSVPRFFIMEASRELASITKLPVTRSENLSDATSNLDPLVEAHAILKAHAANLEKMAADLRLLSSGLADHGGVSIPNAQVGSSVMPGKINPVISEFAISAAQRIFANDDTVAQLAGRGCLELNAYLPTIGHALLDSIKLLIACDETLCKNLLAGIEIDSARATESLYQSPAITAALIPYVGYRAAERAAYEMRERGLSIFDANRELKLVSDEKLREILTPQALLKLGYSLSDITGEDE